MNKVILRDISIKIGSGATPKGGQKTYQNKGIALIRSQNVLDFQFSLNGLAFIDENQAKNLSNVTVKEDDILLNITGDSIARACIVPKELLPARVNQHVAIIRCSKTVNSYYVFYYLQYLKPYLLKISRVGGTRNALTKDVIEKLEINLSENQEGIAYLLLTLDQKLSLNNTINNELELLAKNIFNYWFVQFDFPNEEGKPYKTSGGTMVWNEELKREIPKEWKVGFASDLFDFNPSLSLKKKQMSSYIDMDALPTEGFMTKEVQKKEFNGGVKFQNGDLIIARITPCLENGKTGLITLLEDNEIGFGSTEFIVIRGKGRSLSGFASFLGRSELFRKFAITNMLGTSGRKRVDADALKKFKLAIPEDSILERFEEVTKSFFDIATINTKQNQQLVRLRDWLLPMLMNGQVTVNSN